MNKTFFFVGSACLFLFMNACTKSSKEGEAPVSSDSIRVETDRDSVLYPSDSDTLCMRLVDGTETLTIHKKKRQRIALSFDSQGYTKLSGTLASQDSTANIRFEQIALPDGEMDGPFGRDMAYDLPVQGTYLLFINEDQMAGDPWAGDFEVTVTLSK